MNAAQVRREIELGPIRPPQRLAPYSYALGAEVKRDEAEMLPERFNGDAFGRLILLHNPEGANLHSWSDAPYYSDHSQAQVMWDAPERIGTTDVREP